MKKWRWIFFSFCWFIVLLLVNQYFFCPQYNFETPIPFSGRNIHNPYEGADFSNWKKCNFHTHVKAWGGITRGTSTAADAADKYQALGYDVYCISNYQQVDTYHREQPNYLEAYEHGFGICKNHHTVLGTRKVLWKDYLFPQTLSNKQNLLAALQQTDSAFIIINHPANRRSFPPADFLYLKGYDGIEVYPSGSQAAFDSALSAGRPVFCIANDDAHDITNPDEIGLHCTWVGAASTDGKDILNALRSGRSYIMIFGARAGMSMEEKIAKMQDGYLQVKEVTVRNDSLMITVSDTVAFRFFGQGGKLLAHYEKCLSATYAIQPSDTYVRTRIFAPDGVEINLNPVMRYNAHLPDNNIPLVNENKTLVFRFTGVLIILLFSVAAFSLNKFWR